MNTTSTTSVPRADAVDVVSPSGGAHHPAPSSAPILNDRHALDRKTLLEENDRLKEQLRMVTAEVERAKLQHSEVASAEWAQQNLQLEYLTESAKEELAMKVEELDRIKRDLDDSRAENDALKRTIKQQEVTMLASLGGASSSLGGFLLDSSGLSLASPSPVKRVPSSSSQRKFDEVKSTIKELEQLYLELEHEEAARNSELARSELTEAEMAARIDELSDEKAGLRDRLSRAMGQLEHLRSAVQHTSVDQSARIAHLEAENERLSSLVANRAPPPPPASVELEAQSGGGGPRASHTLDSHSSPHHPRAVGSGSPTTTTTTTTSVAPSDTPVMHRDGVYHDASVVPIDARGQSSGEYAPPSTAARELFPSGPKPHGSSKDSMEDTTGHTAAAPTATDRYASFAFGSFVGGHHTSLPSEAIGVQEEGMVGHLERRGDDVRSVPSPAASSDRFMSLASRYNAALLALLERWRGQMAKLHADNARLHHALRATTYRTSALMRKLERSGADDDAPLPSSPVIAQEDEVRGLRESVRVQQERADRLESECASLRVVVAQLQRQRASLEDRHREQAHAHRRSLAQGVASASGDAAGLTEKLARQSELLATTEKVWKERMQMMEREMEMLRGNAVAGYVL